MTLGECIANYRSEHGLSQRQFALNCGLSNGYIAMLEKGKNPNTGKPLIPNLDTFKAIADAMGLELGELMGKLDNMLVEVNSPTQISLSKDERELIRKFRQLDDRGRKAVMNTLHYEYKMMEDE